MNPYLYYVCAKCGAQVPRESRFCPWCRTPQSGAGGAAATCPECSATTVAGAPYCPQCSAPVAPGECKVCHAPLPPKAKFCPECGKPVA